MKNWLLKVKEFWKSICQKNVILTVLVFFLGLIFQVTDSTLVLLVISMAVISSWWQWRPYPKRPESQLILENLKHYPAVLIKDYNHVLAFNSKQPFIVAAYHSPIPRHLLKQRLSEIKCGEIEGTIANFREKTFLLFQIPLTPYTQIYEVFMTVQGFIEVLEINTQAKFRPAERYEIICLFGLDFHYKDQNLKLRIREKMLAPLKVS
ncbi:MAG: hypothetical protein ACFFCZ_18020 [Promethearchaeota archaeon]